MRRGAARSGPRSTAAAAHLEQRRDALDERADGARRASSRAPCPLIYGCGLTAPVAYRWKAQINENAKLPAFAHELPELDHNEIVGWEGAGDRVPMSAPCFLEDRDQHPRERSASS